MRGKTPYREVANIFNERPTGIIPSKYNEHVQFTVCLNVIDYGQTSIANISKKFGYNRASVRKILWKNKIRAYISKFINTLRELDFDIRLGFSFVLRRKRRFWNSV